jgi:hypothetical protein
MVKEYHLIKGKGWGEKDEDPPEGLPIDLKVRDADTFEEKRIKAILCRSKEDLPDSDVLWLYGRSGHKPEDRPDNPWYLKILEETEPDEIVLEVKKPQKDLGKRSDVIRSLLRDKMKENK